MEVEECHFLRLYAPYPTIIAFGCVCPEIPPYSQPKKNLVGYKKKIWRGDGGIMRGPVPNAIMVGYNSHNLVK
jgi:hypothetical protein